MPAFAAAMAISAWVSPGVDTSTMSMSSRATTSRQSVAYSSQPRVREALRTAERLRPQITFMRGVSFGSKNRPTWRQALLCARPMNA